MIKVAVVGAGRIAQHHLACLRALPSAEPAAVCDRSGALASIAAERFEVPRWFQDSAEMLETIRPDVVHVTTPPSSHGPLARQAMEHGAHVFVEKPVSTSYDELTGLVEHAREKGLHLIENLSTLFNPEVQELQRMVDQGDLGRIVHAEVFLCRHFPPTDPYVDPNTVHDTMALPLGPISDWLPHLASLVHNFVGEHERVIGSSLTTSPGSLLPFDEFRAFVETRGGTGGLAFSANIQPDVYALRVAGTRARATINLFEASLMLERRWPGPKPLNPLVDGLVQAYQLQRASLAGIARKLGGSRQTHAGVWRHIEATYAALSRGEDPPVSIDRILAVSRLVSDIEERVRVASQAASD